MAKLNQLRGRPVYVDLVRTVAMIDVILLHAAGRWTITNQELNQMTHFEFTCWATVDLYQTLGVIGVPLFSMLTGALLLQPEKRECLSAFFKKRWARIGIPTLFWVSAYFAWDFLVQNIEFSSRTFIQGILNGPYTQFWYIYVLVGFYLLTPILRVFVAHVEESIVKYFVVLWFVGVALVPFFEMLTGYTMNNNVFMITGFIGYFVLGTYLITVRISRRTLAALMALGIASTAIGTYALANANLGQGMYFFQEYLSPTIILTSVMLFLLMLSVKPPRPIQNGGDSPQVSGFRKFIRVVSENTFPIFLLHVMIIESIQKGFFGFVINRDTLNPIIEVPLLTAVVFFVCLGIILLLKRIPYVKKIIG